MAAEPSEGGFGEWPALLLALLCVPIILWRLGSYGIVSGDEAFYHGVAESMVETGNWLRIDFRGEHRPYDTFMNSPLQYWLRAALIEIFGSNYWTMRITSALCGVATVLMTYRLVLDLAGRRAAFLAGAVQLTTFQFIYLHSARVGVLEPTLALLFALSAHLFIRDLQRDGRFIGSHLCWVALANLKLPVAIIPPLASLAFFALSPGSRRHLVRWLTTGALLLPIAFGWHLYQWIVQGEPLGQVLGLMAGKSSGAGGFVARRLDNIRYYAGAITYGTFPHIVVFPLAVAGVLATLRSQRERTAWLVIGLHALAIAAFCALVSRRAPRYIIPLYPFLSAFAGVWLARSLDEGIRGARSAAVAIVFALLIWVDASGGPGTQNPFDPFSTAPEALARWRDFGAVGAALGVPLTAIAVGLGLALLRRAIGERLPRAVAWGLVLVVMGYAAVRVSVPLAHTDHQSRVEKVRRSVDAARARGHPIPIPILISQGSPRSAKAKFYFARDFEIVPLPPRGRPYATGYHLYPKGDPRGLSRLEKYGGRRDSPEERSEESLR